MIDVTIRRGERRIIAEEAFQYDKGQKLRISGDLQGSFTVEFVNQGDSAAHDSYTPDEFGVIGIPDRFFESGKNVIALVLFSGLMGDVQTRYEITIPVIRRPPRRQQ